MTSRNTFLIQARLANGLDSQSNLIGWQNQRHAHVPLARRTKARARRHHNAGLLHELLAKRHGIGATTGKLGPHKHRAMCVGTLPAQALKTVAQGIATLLVLQTLCLDLIARAIKARDGGLLDREEHTEVEYVVAHGIASRLHGKRVLFGSRHYIHHDEGVPVDGMREAIERLAREGRSILYLAVDGKLAGLIAIEDPLRPEAAPVIRKLLGRGIRVVMLTGDDERTAAAVAERLGISEYRSQVLPTDKAEVIRSLQAEGHTVAMLGDGINDSPALSAADVGVTLSDGADLAREVADVVLTECRLDGLVTAVDLSKAAMRRIRTDFGLIMTLNTVFLASGLAGFLQPGPSALLHNLTTVGVSLNAMRPMLKAGAELQLEEVSA